MEELLNGPYRYMIFFMIAVFFIYVPFLVISTKKRKNSNTHFLEAHPEASDILLELGMKVTLVNGEKPHYYNKGMNAGIYVIPGEVIIDISYQYNKTRRKTVSIEPTELKFNIEKNKNYKLKFDKKELTYSIHEI